MQGKQRSIPEELAGTARVGRQATANPHFLLGVQRTAGNQAAVRLAALGSPGPGRPLQRSAVVSVQRSATMSLSGLLTSLPTVRYEMTFEVIANDIVGHAWISLCQMQAPGKMLSVGFWPKGWLGAVLGGPAVGPGELRAPDPHEGGADHRQTQVIDHNAFRKVLNVVNGWEGDSYNLLFHNCAGFARAAWLAGTGSSDAIVPDGVHMWTPFEEAQNIEASNKAKGLNMMGSKGGGATGSF